MPVLLSPLNKNADVFALVWQSLFIQPTLMTSYDNNMQIRSLMLWPHISHSWIIRGHFGTGRDIESFFRAEFIYLNLQFIYS